MRRKTAIAAMILLATLAAAVLSTETGNTPPVPVASRPAEPAGPTESPDPDMTASADGAREEGNPEVDISDTPLSPDYMEPGEEADEESGGTAAETDARKARLSEARSAKGMRGDLARLSPEKLTTYLPSIWPVHGVITSPFGPRRSPFTGRPRFHSGIDIAAPLGTPVVAPANGVVIFAGRDGGYGLSVELVHLGGIVTRHAHLSKILARRGEIVRKGGVLGRVGSTGASTGPHLHYEVVVDGAATNPMRHILEPRSRR